MANPNCCFMIIAVTFFFSSQSPRGTVGNMEITFLGKVPCLNIVAQNLLIILIQPQLKIKDLLDSMYLSLNHLLLRLFVLKSNAKADDSNYTHISFDTARQELLNYRSIFWATEFWTIFGTNEVHFPFNNSANYMILRQITYLNEYERASRSPYYYCSMEPSCDYYEKSKPSH